MTFLSDLATKQMASASKGEKGTFVASALTAIAATSGPAKAASLWQQNQMKWTDFVEESKVDEFVKSKVI